MFWTYITHHHLHLVFLLFLFLFLFYFLFFFIFIFFLYILFSFLLFLLSHLFTTFLLIHSQISSSILFYIKQKFWASSCFSFSSSPSSLSFRPAPSSSLLLAFLCPQCVKANRNVSTHAPMKDAQSPSTAGTI